MHDGTNENSGYGDALSCPERDNHIMTPFAGAYYTSNILTFSNCSINSFKLRLSTKDNETLFMIMLFISRS